MYCITMLLLAWVLNHFGFGTTFCEGMKEIFKINLSISGYYVIFFLAGCVGDLFNILRRING